MAYEVDFDDKATNINEDYKLTSKLVKQRQRFESVDEMTGIHALERKHTDLLIMPGKVERREFEYKRHGKLSFTCIFDIGFGELFAYTAKKTHNEKDFLELIQRSVTSDPLVSQWHFINYNLNMHRSASLVHFGAKESVIAFDLGEKNKTGILKTEASRAAFLSNLTYRIVFHYPLRHVYWMK